MVLLGGFIGTLIGYLIAHISIQKERQQLRKRLLIQKLQTEHLSLLIEKVKEEIIAARERH